MSRDEAAAMFVNGLDGEPRVFARAELSLQLLSHASIVSFLTDHAPLVREGRLSEHLVHVAQAFEKIIYNQRQPTFVETVKAMHEKVPQELMRFSIATGGVAYWAAMLHFKIMAPEQSASFAERVTLLWRRLGLGVQGCENMEAYTQYVENTERKLTDGFSTLVDTVLGDPWFSRNEHELSRDALLQHCAERLSPHAREALLLG